MKNTILILAIAALFGSCKKTSPAPTAPTSVITQTQIDTNYMTVKVKWSAPTGGSIKYFNNTGIVSTLDSFQYKRQTDLLNVQVNTISPNSPTSFTICITYNNAKKDTFCYQNNNDMTNALGKGLVYGYACN